MRKIIQFLQEVRAEITHISWPKRDTLIQLTLVVISISIVVSALLGGIDFLLTNAFGAISSAPSNPLVNQIPTPEITPEATASPTLKLTPTQTIKK